MKRSYQMRGELINSVFSSQMTAYASAVDTFRMTAVQKAVFGGALGIFIVSSGTVLLGSGLFLGASGPLLTGLYGAVALVSAGAAVYTGLPLARKIRAKGAGPVLLSPHPPDPSKFVPPVSGTLGSGPAVPLLITAEKQPFLVDFRYTVESPYKGSGPVPDSKVRPDDKGRMTVAPGATRSR
jgi:hypothetical protein